MIIFILGRKSKQPKLPSKQLEALSLNFHVQKHWNAYDIVWLQIQERRLVSERILPPATPANSSAKLYQILWREPWKPTLVGASKLIRKDRLVCFHAKMRPLYPFCPLDLQEYTRRLTNRFFLRAHDKCPIMKTAGFGSLRLISVKWCNPLPQT